MSDSPLAQVLDTLSSNLEHTDALVYSNESIQLVQKTLSMFQGLLSCQNEHKQTSAFMELGGPKLVIKAMKKYPCTGGVQYHASVALYKLVCEDHQDTSVRMANAGVMLRNGILDPILRNIAVDGCDGHGEFPNNIHHVTLDLISAMMVMGNPYFCQHLDELKALVEAIVQSMEHSTCPFTAKKAIAVLLNISGDESDRFIAIRQQIIKSKGAVAVVNAMQGFSSHVDVQCCGIGALCHMSFGLVTAGTIRRLGTMELVCKAMGAFPLHEITQLNSCNFIWAMSNFCPYSDYDELLDQLRRNSVLRRLKDVMANHGGNSHLQALAVSALGTLAKKFKPFQADMAHVGILDLVGYAVGRFGGHGGFAPTLCNESMNLVNTLTEGAEDEQELRVALCTVVPGFMVLKRFLDCACWNPGSASGIPLSDFFTFNAKATKLLVGLGALTTGRGY